jgi:hypothetical protein
MVRVDTPHLLAKCFTLAKQGSLGFSHFAMYTNISFSCAGSFWLYTQSIVL